MKKSNKSTKPSILNSNSKPTKTTKLEPIKIKIHTRTQSRGGSIWNVIIECVCPQSK